MGVWGPASGNVWVVFVNMGVEGCGKVGSEPRGMGWCRGVGNWGGRHGQAGKEARCWLLMWDMV